MNVGREPLSAVGGRLSRREVAVLALLAAVGVGVHTWFVWGSDALDTDRALVLLMARHFARGEFSLYFWQQNYMAALEPLILTPLAWLGWATPVVAGLVAVGVTAGMAALCVALTRRMGGVAWMALLLWAVPPAVVVHHHVALYGARLVATLLCLVAFTWSLRTPSRREWVGIGALVGLAYFGDHLMLPWVVGVAWVAARGGHLKALALGAVPLVLVDTVSAMMTPAIHLSGPNDPGSWIQNIPLLFGTTLPQLFGLLLSRGPSPLFEPPAGVVPQGFVWLLFAVPGAVALVVLFGTLARRRAQLLGTQGGGSAVAAQALLLVCVTGLGLFGLVGGGGDRWPVRYLVPLWPAISIFAGLAVTQWKPRFRPLALLVALPPLFTLLSDDTWPRGGDGPPATEEAVAVGQAVAASGAKAVWADYWDSYRMALLVGESPPWIPLRIIERRPEWRRLANESTPVAYLVRHADLEVLDLLERSPAQGIRHLGDQDVGRFRLVVVERAVPGVGIMNPPPPRGWQMLAAFGAGLLFLGTLVAVGLGSRLLSPTRGSRTAPAPSSSRGSGR